MRRIAVLGSTLVVAALGSLAWGGDPDGIVRQKAISHPFVDAVRGRWITTRPHGQGKGTVALSLGVRDTVLLEEWETVGDPFSMQAHAVYRLADDGRTMTCWWFDDERAEPFVLNGPLTKDGFDLAGNVPGSGDVLHHVLRRTPTGFAFRVSLTMPHGESVRHYEEWTREPAGSPPPPPRGAPDAEGAMVGPWSEVVRGIRGRLVTSLDDLDRGAPFVSVYVELEHVHASASDIELGADRQVEVELLDAEGKPVPTQGFCYDGPVAAPVAIVLANHDRVRSKVSAGGCGSPPGGVMVCFLRASWFIADKDPRAFYVRGTLRRDGKDEGGSRWIGRLDLPPTPVDRRPN